MPPRAEPQPRWTTADPQGALSVLLRLASSDPVSSRVADEDRLATLAIDHHMEGLLWSAVRDNRVEVGPGVERRLAMLQLRSEARHRRLWSDLQEIAGKLAESSFEIGTFKGVTFERAWYDRLGERPSADLDLFVAPADVDRLDTIVALIAPALDRREEMVELAMTGHLETLDIQMPSGTWIDLHLEMFKWALHPRNPQMIWDRCDMLELDNGISVRVPDATLSLIVALINVNRDRFRTVRGLADIARILRKGDIDWEFFHRVLDVEGYTVHCLKTLATTCELLGISPPIDTRVSGPRAWVWDRVWSEDVRLPGTSGVFDQAVKRYYWGPFLVDGRFMDASRWWLRRVVPPPEVVRYWYPDIAGPAYWRMSVGRYRSWRKKRRRARARSVAP